MPKVIPNPNIRFSLLLQLLNRENDPRWRAYFQDALKKTSRAIIRNIRTWQPNAVYTVLPLPPEKVGILAALDPEQRTKVKREQWHNPTDFYQPLLELARLLIRHGPGRKVADAFNQLTSAHDIWAIPQVSCWEAGQLIPAWGLRPGGVTDIYVTQFSDLLLSQCASRLRQCPTCKLYFIARRRTAKRCTPTCTDRYWTRARREKAQQKRARAKGQR